jgi:hypothetical protein
MVRRALPALLVAVAALADAGGFPDLALYALLAAIAALALAALAALGELIDGDRPAPAHQLQALLWGVALLLVVGGAAVSAPGARTGELPALADSALFACLVVLALEAAVGAARAAVEPPARPRRTAPPAEQWREAA